MLLGWLLRLLLAVLIIRLVWRFVAGLLGRGGENKVKSREHSVELVRDPVCGTYLEPGRALKFDAGTTVHYFCSESCHRAFLKTT